MDVDKEIWDDDVEIAVVGGGGAGLMAALITAERGAKVSLLEREGELGGKTALSMGLGQIYTATERGVVEGFVLPFNFVLPTRLYKVVKYRVDPGVYNPAVMVLVNLGAWKRMNDAQRSFMEGMGLFIEGQVNQDFFRKNDEMGAKLLELGVELVQLPKAEAERLGKMSQDAIWGAAMKTGAQFTGTLKPLVTK